MHTFVNDLRIMRCLDAYELTGRGISQSWAKAFVINPYTTMMRMDEESQAAVWEIIQARRPKPRKDSE